MYRCYDNLGLEDIFLNFAGRRPIGDRVHRHLAGLRQGSCLFIAPRGENVEFRDEQGVCVARLSQVAEKNGARLDCIEWIIVLAMVERHVTDCRDEYRDRRLCGQWEVPVVEVVYHER